MTYISRGNSKIHRLQCSFLRKEKSVGTMGCCLGDERVLAQDEILSQVPFGKQQEVTVRAGRALTKHLVQGLHLTHREEGSHLHKANDQVDSRLAIKAQGFSATSSCF